MKTLYPFKINYYNFCKRYLELKSDEHRFLSDLSKEDIKYENLTKALKMHHNKLKQKEE